MADQTPILENPAIGHNRPPQEMLLTAADLAVVFPDRYAGLSREVADLLADIRSNAPADVTTESDNGVVAAFMEKLRSSIKNADGCRIKEKAQYLAAERFIDQFHGAMVDRLSKARDILQKRGDAYTARVVAEERARRQREAAAKLADEARIVAAKRTAEQEAADLAAAADRARKTENIQRLEQQSENKIGQAAALAVDQLMAASQAEAATIAALAPSADIARTRHESGHLSTARQTPHVEIVDVALLDLNVLRPFIKEEELLRALKAWAKTTGHKRNMPGAIIELRDAAAYR